MDTLFLEEVNVREQNIAKSPKKFGSCDVDSKKYLEQLGIKILDKKQRVQFNQNTGELIHRWSPYVQGFSSSFVQSELNKYRNEYISPVVLDPFSGSGTVQVQSKINGLHSVGTELNPLLHFISSTKLNCWDVPSKKLKRAYENLDYETGYEAPVFLKSGNHFRSDVLKELENIIGGINSVKEIDADDVKIKNLLKVAFSSILIEASNLKRSPCLGYYNKKFLPEGIATLLMEAKVNDIANDLEYIQAYHPNKIYVTSDVILDNAMSHNHSGNHDLVITSPPYMNGLDYVMNYKIEMGWLGFANSQKELKKVKDEMVVCDNVSKGLINNHRTEYTNEWIEKIKLNIERNIAKRGAYRRTDMPGIVHKYFDDMYNVIRNVSNSLNEGGRIIMVIGDSLIADEYVPTDLLLTKIGMDLGLQIESIEKARDRRSGQIRTYKLRETIVTLKKI